MEILNSASMAEADRLTIEETGIPSIVLMENAATSVYEVINSLNVEKERIAIVAGSGNNGGDGFALARRLVNSGYIVDVFACHTSKLKNDAKTNYEILKKFPVSIIELENEVPSFDGYDITIDAVFGTGFKGVAEDFYAELIESINETSNYVVAVDIPSGLSGDSHLVKSVCVDADTTVTFCRPKIPHCMFPAKKFCGEIVVTDISIPDTNIEAVNDGLYLVTEDILPPISRRISDSHKGTHGHAVIVGGSAGKTGAAIMASLATSAVGAGLVTCAVPAKLNYSVECSSLETMSLPIGTEDYFSKDNSDETAVFLQDKKVFALGTGIGRNTETGEFVRKLIKQTTTPTVIDADGLFHIDTDSLKSLSGRSVLTPHLGEFARMLGVSVDEVQEQRLSLAREFASKHGVVLVLKSADTIISTPEGACFINSNGSPALAKSGSGDCLTGLITGLIAQGYELEEAAVLGCYILGEASHKATEEISERSVKTTDIINAVGMVLSELEV
jgi:hydroxyethylthiazole kinase-like uncharacterized protein yjeF